MERPNIIIIMTDQQQAKMTAREGFKADLTPFLDSLARSGTWFNRAYTTSPICSPARVSMLTGRYPSAHHVMNNCTRLEKPNFTDSWIVDKDDVIYEKDLLDLLRERKYATALIGKNHAHPNNDKFDYACSFHHKGGFYEGKTNDEIRFDNWLESFGDISMEPCPFDLKLQLPYRAVTRAIKWVEKNRDKKFMLWLSFPEPHNPYQAPEPYYSMFDGEKYVKPEATVGDVQHKNARWRILNDMYHYVYRNHELERQIKRARTNYMGMIRLIDDQIKRFIQHLKQMGLYERSIILFVSDHGEMAGEFGKMTKGFGMPECLIRIPLFFVGPGIVANPNPSEAHVSIADIMPTLCEAVQIEIPNSVQGKSLWPILTGQTYPPNEFSSAYCEFGVGGQFYTPEIARKHSDLFYKDRYYDLNAIAVAGITRMVRKDSWKLIFTMDGKGELYNLEDDPNEINNLYNDMSCTETKIALVEEMLKWCLRIQDPMVIRKEGRQIKTKRLIDKRNYWFGEDFE